MPEEKVFLNGEIIPLEEARLSIGDRIILFGDGLFETVRAYRGSPFRLDRHLERLLEGCRILRMNLTFEGSRIKEAVRALINENGLGGGDARVRITVTGGPFDGNKRLQRSLPSNIFITAVPYEGFPEEVYKEGIPVIISSINRNPTSPLASIKSTNYLDSLIAVQEAKDSGADDAVMLTPSGNLAEATSSNLFLVKEGEVLTPDLGCGFLPGVTREAIIEACGKLGIVCRAMILPKDSLLSAEEVFITNSMIEIMPVNRVANEDIDRCPGPVTQRLISAYRDLVNSELPV